MSYLRVPRACNIRKSSSDTIQTFIGSVSEAALTYEDNMFYSQNCTFTLLSSFIMD